jgi:hypothetical protein
MFDLLDGCCSGAYFCCWFVIIRGICRKPYGRNCSLAVAKLRILAVQVGMFTSNHMYLKQPECVHLRSAQFSFHGRIVIVTQSLAAERG